MTAIQIALKNGKSANLDVAALEQLKSSFRGTLFQPGDEGYDQARSIWNGMIDRKPALIARCAGVADVRRAVDFARTHQLLTAVRGGGHNIAGNAVCDGGFMIDLSGMRSVRVDPAARIAHAEPGATLGDFDHETQGFGLATPVGINSTTGIAGLTLGAGFGWLSRKHGMTIDNLTAVDVVTADGKLVRANEKENPDLFWAVRGGSGNFGIVTRFEFRLHPVGPEVFCGLVAYAIEDAVQAIRQYRKFSSQLGDETSVWMVLRKAPPLPFLPEKYHGQGIVAFACFHSGDPDKGKAAVEPVRKFGKPIGEHLGVQPYTIWQTLLDPLLAPGARNYWKSHNFTDLSDGLVDTLVKLAKNIPHPETEIAMAQLGAQTTRVAPDATAYPHRNANYVMNVHGRWREKADDEKCIAWARQVFQETAPFATGGVYVNFLTKDEDERVRAAYGPHFARLQSIKKKYDPENLFCMNQNISPAD